MNYHQFYETLFTPIEERIGPIDENTILAIIGYGAGGPVNLSTVGYGREPFVTYVTCELAVRGDQRPAECGRFELMMTCDDEAWARNVLTGIGEMSLELVLGHGHSVDIESLVGPDFPLQGLAIEEFARVSVEGSDFGILRLHGLTRPELDFAIEFGVDELIERLKSAHVYPRTSVRRTESDVLSD
jgi:hypothetical protein